MWKYLKDFLSFNALDGEQDKTVDAAFTCDLSGQERGMVRRLALSTQKLSGMHSMGVSASRYYGAGLEFDSVREYDIGDDVRRLDWNVTARTGRLHTKVFTEDRSLSVCTAVHLTPTMEYTTRTRTKAEVAVRFAKLVNELVRFQNDFYSAAILSPVSFQFFKPSQNASSWSKFYSSFLHWTMTSPSPAIPSSIPESTLFPKSAIKFGPSISQHLPAGAILIVISDFLDDNLKSDLSTLKRKYDLIVVRVLDQAEISIPPDGLAPLTLVDFSSLNDVRPVKLDHVDDVNLTLARENANFTQFCKNEGLDFLEINTNQSELVRSLENLLKSRKLKGKSAT